MKEKATNLRKTFPSSIHIHFIPVMQTKFSNNLERLHNLFQPSADTKNFQNRTIISLFLDLLEGLYSDIVPDHMNSRMELHLISHIPNRKK